MGADISPKLLELAAEKTPPHLADRISYRAGDMLDAVHGTFHYVVAMDSLIHYRAGDIASALARLSGRLSEGMIFIIAPKTTLLTAMHMAGKLFPRGDRSPAIQPVSTKGLKAAMRHEAALTEWVLHPGARVSSGFYISQAMEVRPS